MHFRFPGALLLFVLLSLRSYGQTLSPPAADSCLVAKLSPLLALFEATPAVRNAAQADNNLQRLTRRQAARTYQALRRGPRDARHYADSLVWQPQEIKTVANELIDKYLTDDVFRARVGSLLTPAGPYPGYAALADTAALRRAWQDAALGLNHILRVYLGSEKPRYPAIDSISFGRHDAALAAKVRAELLRAARRPAVFYALPLRAALLALRLNGRNEAVRYEPLRAGLNAAPAAAVAGTDWGRYPYSVLLVPGKGPEQAGVALDSASAYRCRLAAARYRAGLAPFVVVSGGHVHPNKTPYNEAVEMKKYLVEQLQLPAAAVFIEPYARHTTTNLRNVARMMEAFGLPMDKRLLIVTDASQSRYIVGMAERCRRELGYVPYRDLQRLSDIENSCLPVSEARQPNPYEPLDP